MLDQDLLTLGLSEKEAKVYLAALELGKATAQIIAKKSRINRATTYFVLRSLMKLGLMSEVDDGKTTRFTAESPERMEVLLKRKEEDIKISEKLLSKVLPELRSIYNHSGNKPIVRYYDGPEGPRILREEILKKTKNDTIYSFTNFDLIQNVFTAEENKKFREQKVKQGIKTVVLYTSRGKIEIADKGIESYRADEKECIILADIFINGDTVQISRVYSDTNYGVITIEDKEIAHTIKSLLTLAIKAVKK